MKLDYFKAKVVEGGGYITIDIYYGVCDTLSLKA